MVWGFFPADPLAGEHTYYIFATGTYKVGRKGCDVNIAKDKGVSRVHAEIIVDSMISALPRQTKSSVLSSKVRIRDCSKYGTYINKNLTSVEKIHELPNKETSLRDGDMVSFGTGTAVFRFSFVPLILFACCPENSRVNHPLQEKISSIGARITYHWSQECTHVLVDQVMPMKEDLLDGIMEKKPFVVGSWVEFVAEKNILTEFPSYTPFSPTMTMEGISVKLADPRSRENCLKGYTFLLDSTLVYKFGDRLQSLLEVSGAEILLIEGFKSKSQIPDCAVSDRVVCVVPERVSDDCSDKLGSLLRVNELGLLCAILNGRLDPCMLKSPCVVVSSSCSTDETVVADSDVEETATSVLATASVGTGVVENVPHAVTKSENNFVMSSRRSSDISTIRGKLDDSESGIADIIYSQDLIARDKSIPCTVVTSANNRFINFKRFRKTNTQSGNSFNNLIPFSKDPYNESDYGSEEVVQSVTDEKRRKHMEAISEELFNNEQGRRRGVAGSLRGILSHGK
ncbi:putative transcription factor interactor and regulator FHA-SMAD family [Rosa chinensis]|uniref:Putative transcription factor interactor and regulator FHA-SMAD family n=2 Tax=Rosa chinensis TaxID=74649 RepID=A0A2P6PIF4_ROSCH|nr:nijmegen breakage syndrome 1 protein isoform X1 [Rosa chinensis]XP_024169586.1 nijmegen breakage syndrome 1 protein isoform X1 [Rosa chinensis]PRQ21694.1 putative transcription factor interactor and regulator FHA-SMAD family [Rosa chinensis]